jgi:hypothetical protein
VRGWEAFERWIAPGPDASIPLPQCGKMPISTPHGVHRFRLREGRVVEWRGFEDTALACEALGL